MRDEGVACVLFVEQAIVRLHFSFFSFGSVFRIFEPHATVVVRSKIIRCPQTFLTTPLEEGLPGAGVVRNKIVSCPQNFLTTPLEEGLPVAGVVRNKKVIFSPEFSYYPPGGTPRGRGSKT